MWTQTCNKKQMIKPSLYILLQHIMPDVSFLFRHIFLFRRWMYSPHFVNRNCNIIYKKAKTECYISPWVKTQTIFQGKKYPSIKVTEIMFYHWPNKLTYTIKIQNKPSASLAKLVALPKFPCGSGRKYIKMKHKIHLSQGSYYNFLLGHK